VEAALVAGPAGAVRGQVLADGVRRFLGIPYAQPPVGPFRFHPPVRREPWAGELDATSYGATAPQSAPSGPLGDLLPRRAVAGDDYLNLNVWVPPSGDGHAVMVFVHGGSWTSGAGSIGGYDGARFARDGVVLVSINYRLGADGFAWFGDGVANLAQLDQITALEWVRDNIAAFGGDPGNVTVFGESSGAMSIGALLAMPAAKGLFGRAVMESGSTFHTISADSARKVAVRLARILGVEPSRDGLATVPVERLLAAQTQVSVEMSKRPFRALWGDAATNLLAFEPVVDGDTLPVRPLDALRSGAADDIDLLVGWNRDEANLFLVPSGLDSFRAWARYLLAARTRLPIPRGIRAYRAAEPHAGRSASSMLTDWVYRVPAIRTAEAHPRTHLYEFAWRSPAFDGAMGACHGAELPFVFDNLDHPDWAGLVGEAPAQQVADDVHGAWIAFARTGDPGWSRYTAEERAVRRFDLTSATLLDPDGDLRTVWAGVR
jgi:para-nitrobenzyl esterase